MFQRFFSIVDALQMVKSNQTSFECVSRYLINIKTETSTATSLKLSEQTNRETRIIYLIAMRHISSIEREARLRESFHVLATYERINRNGEGKQKFVGAKG